MVVYKKSNLAYFHVFALTIHGGIVLFLSIWYYSRWVWRKKSKEPPWHIYSNSRKIGNNQLHWRIHSLHEIEEQRLFTSKRHTIPEKDIKADVFLISFPLYTPPEYEFLRCLLRSQPTSTYILTSFIIPALCPYHNLHCSSSYHSETYFYQRPYYSCHRTNLIHTVVNLMISIRKIENNIYPNMWGCLSWKYLFPSRNYWEYFLIPIRGFSSFL